MTAERQNLVDGDAMPRSESSLTRPASKRLLIVSREFPPSQLIGGQRVSAFSKFLPEHGIAVHVVTAGSAQDESESRTSDLRETFPEYLSDSAHISYVSDNVHPARPVLRARKRLDDICRQKGIAALFARVARKPLSAYAFFTYGEHNVWVRSAVREATRVAEETPFDAVFASFGGEYWNLGAASRIAKRLRIPLILDFRDGWDWFFGFNGKRSRLYPMMRRFISSSRLVTGATQSVIDRIAQFWPHVPVAVVPNGHDVSGEAFVIGSRISTHPDVRIGYLGTFWPNPRWPFFRKALDCAAETASVRFVYRGKNPEQVLAEVVGITPTPVGITFDIGGLCEKSEIVTLYGELDMVVAAAFDEDQSMGAIPAKLIEAIGFAKPFVLLADRSPGYMRDFLHDCDSPYLLVDDATTSDELASFILKMKHRPVNVPRSAENYSARRRARELTELLLNVMSESAKN